MRRRGLVLILAIFFLGLLQLLVLAFARRLPLELYGSVRYELDNEAFLAADAGLQHTLAWLEDRLAAGAEPVPTAPSITRTGKLNGFDWEVEVTPDPETPPNVPDGGQQRAYWLVSQARRGNVVYRSISLGVKQESFAYYARLVDNWPPDIVSLAGEEGYDGPVHTNSALRVGLKDDYVTHGPVLFKGGVSYNTSEDFGNPDNVDYNSFFTGPRPYAGATKAERRQRYRRLYGKKGKGGLKQDGIVPLPSPDENLRRFSHGPGPLPTAPGVYVPNDGTRVTHGVFIQGDVDSLVLQDVGGQARQRIRLANGEQYVITERADDTTEIQGPSGLTTYARHPNGLLFCTGDIRALSGVNRGPHTVAVATGANRKVTLAGDLLPATTLTPPEKPADGADSLGIIAHSLVLPGGPVRRHVYGALLLCGPDGQGGVTAEDAYAGPLADLYFIGSVTTQRTHVTMMPGTGWSLHFLYNKHLRASPPPAFPGLSDLMVVAYSCE